MRHGRPRGAEGARATKHALTASLSTRAVLTTAPFPRTPHRVCVLAFLPYLPWCRAARLNPGHVVAVDAAEHPRAGGRARHHTRRRGSRLGRVKHHHRADPFSGPGRLAAGRGRGARRRGARRRGRGARAVADRHRQRRVQYGLRDDQLLAQRLCRHPLRPPRHQLDARQLRARRDARAAARHRPARQRVVLASHARRAGHRPGGDRADPNGGSARLGAARRRPRGASAADTGRTGGGAAAAAPPSPSGRGGGVHRRGDGSGVGGGHLGLRVPDLGAWPACDGRRRGRFGLLGDDVRRARPARPGGRTGRGVPGARRRGRRGPGRRRAHDRARARGSWQSPG